MGTSGFFPRNRITIVGVLNLTPDSFSDGGRFMAASAGVDVEGALVAAKELVANGAHVIDVGGESTRPGAPEVSLAVECARTLRVVAAVAGELDAAVSIDTRKSEVARRALEEGACIVNDVSGGRHDPEILSVAAERGATMILGHLRGTPATMQDAPNYGDAIEEVGEELAASLSCARAAGLGDQQLVVDPGIGFGKLREHNLALLANLGALRERLGRPLLVGTSRKSFLGQLTGDPVDQRDIATVAADAIAVFCGADALRVHDAAAARRAAAVGAALRAARRTAA